MSSRTNFARIEVEDEDVRSPPPSSLCLPARNPATNNITAIVSIESPKHVPRDYNIVFRLSEPSEKTKETRGTMLIHQALQEHRREAETFEFENILAEAYELLRDEFPQIPSVDREVILIECTPSIIARNFVKEQSTHAFDEEKDITYGTAAQPVEALRYYFFVWNTRIPRSPGERDVWVNDIEEQFCEWQLTPVSNYQSNEKIENLRLAIQFVKKWMASSEPGLTDQMIEGHLKLVQKGWEELRTTKIPTTAAAAAAAAATKPLYTEQKEVPHPVEFFQTLPVQKTDRWEYLRKIKENYEIWKDTPVAAQFRQNILLAFEKLLFHTQEWLDYKDTEPKMTESTIQMFFSLLKERWNEFMEKTKIYTDRVLRRKRSRSSDDADSQGERSRRARAKYGDSTLTNEKMTFDSVGAVASYMSDFLDSKPSAVSSKFEVSSIVFDSDAESECSQVSPPFPSQFDENPMRSDATKNLFEALQNNDSSDLLASVQHCFTQGALANGRDEFGESPLHKAATTGNIPVLNHLRLWGGDPWVCSYSGELPLHVACWVGDLAVVKHLWKRMGDVTPDKLQDSQGRTPFHVACQHGHDGIVRWFCEQYDTSVLLESRDNDNLTPWHYARMSGREELVHWLAMVGADTSDEHKFDPTSLHDACATGRLGLVQWLVETSSDLDLESKNFQGLTPLEAARKGGHLHVVEWMESCLFDIRKGCG